MTSTSTRARVLVTGASRGIGLGIAEGFAAAGADVVLTGRSEASVASARARLADAGVEARGLVADVSDRAGCVRMVEDAIALLGGLDVLCANAGIYPEVRIEDAGPDHVDQVIDTNLKGTIYTVQAARQALAESGRGRVVVTASITGATTGFPGLSVYGASKAAQLGFVRSAALELAPLGITINAVNPGTIRTEGLEDFGEEAIATMERCIPAGRLGEPRDIAAAAMFLASEEAGFITGQSIIVDGGQTLPELPDY